MTSEWLICNVWLSAVLFHLFHFQWDIQGNTYVYETLSRTVGLFSLSLNLFSVFIHCLHWPFLQQSNQHVVFLCLYMLVRILTLCTYDTISKRLQDCSKVLLMQSMNVRIRPISKIKIDHSSKMISSCKSPIYCRSWL